MYAVVILVVLLLCGCDPVQRIASNTNQIRAEAQTLIAHGRETGDPVVVDGATRIDGYAADIHGDLPYVEAKTPAWLDTLRWWGIAIVAVSVLLLLWKSGVLTAIRIAVGWLPRKEVREAEMAVSVLDDGSKENTREMVAARRASDPVFDAAFRRASRKRGGSAYDPGSQDTPRKDTNDR